MLEQIAESQLSARHLSHPSHRDATPSRHGSFHKWSRPPSLFGAKLEVYHESAAPRMASKSSGKLPVTSSVRALSMGFRAILTRLGFFRGDSPLVRPDLAEFGSAGSTNHRDPSGHPRRPLNLAADRSPPRSEPSQPSAGGSSGHAAEIRFTDIHTGPTATQSDNPQHRSTSPKGEPTQESEFIRLRDAFTGASLNVSLELSLYQLFRMLHAASKKLIDEENSGNCIASGHNSLSRMVSRQRRRSSSRSNASKNINICDYRSYFEKRLTLKGA